MFTNRCAAAKCRGKEAVPLVCNECRQNYCFKHRHPLDHSCAGSAKVVQRKITYVDINRFLLKLFNLIYICIFIYL